MIVRYKVESVKETPSDREYHTLVSRGVSIILLLIVGHAQIGPQYTWTETKDNLGKKKQPQYL